MVDKEIKSYQVEWKPEVKNLKEKGVISCANCCRWVAEDENEPLD